MAESRSKQSSTSGRTVSNDTLSLNEVNLFAVRPTATDAMGQERFVGPAIPAGYEPAQVEPTDEQKATNERAHQFFAEARERRLKAIQPEGVS